jgi:MinD-like ATPase involved in chromosome partitioning or flagellar assembly
MDAKTSASTSRSNAPGLVCTFYSYKGGVGRSMALANVAAMLARWGQKVLVIDWDLEAPGLERYFGDRVIGSRRNQNGLIDIVASFGSGATLDWHDCLLQAKIPQGETIDILHAGKEGDTYLERLRRTNWETLFEAGLGNFLEDMRSEWTEKYDYILIDSRTGITDIGGICTILLPDYLVSLFTTNDQSVQGVQDTMARARERQGSLPLKRRRMVIIPIAARDESATEYKLAAEWRKKFAAALERFYLDWIHKDETAESVLDYLKIPYVAYWSFGEQLPVLKEDAQNPKMILSYSYALIARLIHSRLDWTEVREGRQTSELQQQREAEAQNKLAEAVQVRAVLQARQQADEKELFAERAQILARRYDQLLRSMRWQASIFGGATAICLLLGLLPGIQAYQIYMNNGQFSVPYLAGVYAAVAAVAAAGLWFRKFNRRVLALEREQNAYNIRSGDYADLGDGYALLLFSDRIETIAIGAATKQSASAAAPGAGPAPPADWAPSTLSPPSLPSPPSAPTPPSMVAEDGGPVDVFLDYAEGGIVREWMREFTPLLRTWLSESLGRDVRIMDSAQIPVGANWESTVRMQMQRAGLIVAVVSPRYLSSAARMELLMSASEKGPSFGGPVVITLDKAVLSDLPSMLRSTMIADFSDLAYVGEGFSRSERYVDFQDRVRKLASEMASRLKETDSRQAVPA